MLPASATKINDGKTATVPQVNASSASASASTGGFLTPQTNAAITLTRHPSPGMMAGGNAGSGANTRLNAPAAVYTEDNGNHAVLADAANTSTAKSASFLTGGKNIAASNPLRDETTAKAGSHRLFSAGDTATDNSVQAISVADARTNALAGSTTEQAVDIATDRVAIADARSADVKTDAGTAFLPKNRAPGNTGLFSGKTRAADTADVALTASTAAVASTRADATVLAGSSTASMAAASIEKTTSISVSTSEEGMPGFYANPGSVTLTESSIITAGPGGTGIFSTEGSAVNMNTSVVATAGIGAAGISASGGTIALAESAVATAGDGSTGIFSADAGTVSVTRSAVATAGAGAAGITAIAGAVSLADSTVRTIGNDSTGIFAITSGTVDATNTTITTSGDNAHGVFTYNGAVTLNGSPVSTHGSGSAGIFSDTAGSVTATDTTVITTGDSASGVVANSGAVTLADSSVNTHGSVSTGIFSGASGTVKATNTTVITTGDSADGVLADNGAVTLNDSSVNTRGSASAGIFSGGAGTVSAANSTIITSGDNASGVAADNGAVTLTDSAVNTRGSASAGIFSGGAGTVSAANSTIITSGDNASGVAADNGAVTLTDSTVNTRGSTSAGIFSDGAGTVSAANSTIITSGDNASGVAADSGAVTLTDSTVNTHGSASAGIFSGSAGHVDATGSDITTAGENAYALSVNQGAISISSGMLNAGNAAAIFTTGSNAGMEAGSVNLDAVTVNAAQSSVLSRGGMLNLNATSTTFNSATNLVLDVQADAADPSLYSTVNLNADSSVLNGSLVSDNMLNTSNVSLINASSLTGYSQNISSVTLDSTSRWNMTADSDVQSLTNNGTIIFSAPTRSDYTTLTVNGNYAGNGGTLVMNTLLGGDSSPTDKLIVTGNVETGDTKVSINNMGGSGAYTVEGIEVVSVGGVSEGTFSKSGRIVAGAYDYNLEKINESWYLTSKAPDITDPGTTDPDVTNPGTTDPGTTDPGVTDPEPGPDESQYRPETGSYLANMLAANTMFDHRMQDRLGEGSYARSADGAHADGLWMRHIGSHNRFYDDSGQLKARTNRYVLQLGYDLAQWSSDGYDRWHLGVMGGYGNAQSNIRSGITGYRADSKVEGYSAGVYATWVESEKDMSGAYVDGWVLYNWFRNTINGQELATEKYDSKGFTASLETGYTVPMSQGERVSSWLQPKVQLTWMDVGADNHREHNGTWVTDDTDGMLRSRVGIRAYLKGHSELDNNTGRDFQPFVEANWLHNFGDYSVKMDDVTNSIAGDKNVGELKLGVEGKIANDFTLWGNVAQQVGSAGYSDTSAVLGTRVNF